MKKKKKKSVAIKKKKKKKKKKKEKIMSEEEKIESIPLEQENIDSKSTEVSIKEPEEIYYLI